MNDKNVQSHCIFKTKPKTLLLFFTELKAQEAKQAKKAEQQASQNGNTEKNGVSI